MTLAEFLLARIAEDEAVANEVPGPSDEKGLSWWVSTDTYPCRLPVSSLSARRGGESCGSQRQPSIQG